MKPIELEYVTGEDGMLYPVLDYDKRDVGKYGRMFINYLKEHNPVRHDCLLMEDRLTETAFEVNEEAHQAIENMVKEMLKSDPIKDPNNFMETYRHKNTLQAIAESTVIRELVLKDR